MLPDATPAEGKSVINLNLKEIVMSEQTQSELDQQVVDLGDAKELTKGTPFPAFAEENPLVQGKDY